MIMKNSYQSGDGFRRHTIASLSFDRFLYPV